MKTYTEPRVVDYGNVATVTATLGNPFTGDLSFDVDGNVLESGENSINQCPTINNEQCHFNEGQAP